MKRCIQNFWIVSTVAIAYLAASQPIAAQIIPDTTLPVNSLVTPDANTSVITNGTTAGVNLFHSFREFSVLTGNTAYFNNAVEIQNIITRVTGSSISNIDGILKANGSANLFLINPNGIIFGPNAQLNIGGSFLASSASSIKFADGSSFDATNPSAPPLLTVSVPIGLQFGPNPGRIVVQGTGHNLSYDPNIYIPVTDNRPVGLQVPDGQTLALVGGEIALEGGNITAHSGRIELGSVGASSYVSLNSPPSGIGWSLGYSLVENFSNISLSNAASADASGNSRNIQVRSRNLTLSDGSAILALAQDNKNGGKVEVSAAESVERIGTISDAQYPSNIGINVQPEATGTGGNLTIETGRLILRDGAQINSSSSSLSSTSAGTITVRASDLVEASGIPQEGNDFTGFLADTGGTGDGGDIIIETGRLILRDGAQISSVTFNSGRGGSVTVKARDSVELIGTTLDGVFSSGLLVNAQPYSTGDGGDLIVETGRLILSDGAKIDVGTFAAGKGGNITIRARDYIELVGTTKKTDFATGLYANTYPAYYFSDISTGDGGNMTVETGRLIVRDGAVVRVGSQGTGAVGNLTVNAGAIRLNNRAVLTAETPAGGGNIILNSRDIQLRNNSNINTNATGTSAGGNITLNTDTLAALENSDITANSEESFGGRVVINAQGIFGTEFRSSTSDLTSDITASSALGADFSGTVEINTPDVAPAAGLLTLPSGLVDVSRLIASECEAFARGSSFIVTGKGGLPPNPTEPLVGSVVVVDWATREGRGQIWEGKREEFLIPPSPIVEATGWARNEKGQVVLIANAPSGNSSTPWYQSPGCQGVR